MQPRAHLDRPLGGGRVSNLSLPPDTKISVPMDGMTIRHLRFLVQIADALKLPDEWLVTEELHPMDSTITVGLAIDTSGAYRVEG